MAEKNIKIIVEYKGTAFAGWQIQAGQPTLQGAITEAVFKVTGQKINLIGAGRTDAGVHALGQVANFLIDHRLEPDRYAEAINFYLSDDIYIRESSEIALDFNARFKARYRRYRYLMAAQKPALYREYRWEHRRKLDFNRLQEAAQMVLGEHDFSPFCVVSSRKEDNNCFIEFSRWFQIGSLWVYEIRGNRFLHSMVRSLVGAMVNLADLEPDNNVLNLTLEQFNDIINFQTDKRVAFAAPAQGLYLVAVGY
ncbi:MAG: tRNA pseudouridine(38-40) synthase TruA [candidate division Zixibacteria bacterium]|nr:tRNA pseudouridine(38-40) synthase TruA [candidate division Zixibacteria bacterium]